MTRKYDNLFDERFNPSAIAEIRKYKGMRSRHGCHPYYNRLLKKKLHKRFPKFLANFFYKFLETDVSKWIKPNITLYDHSGNELFVYEGTSHKAIKETYERMMTRWNDLLGSC